MFDTLNQTSMGIDVEAGKYAETKELESKAFIHGGRYSNVDTFKLILETVVIYSGHSCIHS